ncbi:hypothetical protein Q7P37_008912 [Cladosporium fusiforme]
MDNGWSASSQSWTPQQRIGLAVALRLNTLTADRPRVGSGEESVALGSPSFRGCGSSRITRTARRAFGLDLYFCILESGFQIVTQTIGVQACFGRVS